MEKQQFPTLKICVWVIRSDVTNTVVEVLFRKWEGKWPVLYQDDMLQLNNVIDEKTFDFNQLNPFQNILYIFKWNVQVFIIQ